MKKLKLIAFSLLFLAGSILTTEAQTVQSKKKNQKKQSKTVVTKPKVKGQKKVVPKDGASVVAKVVGPRLEKTAEMNMAPGYKNAHPFILNNRIYMMGQNVNSNAISVWDFKRGARPLVNKRWNKGWDNFEVFKMNNNNYFFHQNNNNGAAEITRLNMGKINSGSDVGERVFSKKWAKGWKNTKFFKHNNKTYFFQYKKNNGKARIFNVNANGKIGGIIYDRDWEKGWELVEFVKLNGKVMFFNYNRTNGKMKVIKMNMKKLELATQHGLLSPRLGKVIMNKNIGNEWTNVSVFKKEGKLYFLRYNNTTGHILVNEFMNNNMVQQAIIDKEIRPEWSNFEILYMNNTPFVFHQNKQTGQTRVSKIILE